MWQKYIHQRFQRIFGYFWYSIGVLSTAIAIIGYMMTVFLPDLSRVLATSLWGGGLVVLTGLVAIIFLLSLTKWGRKVISTFPWEIEADRKEKTNRKSINVAKILGRFNKRLKAIEDHLAIKGSDNYGKIQSTTETRAKETKSKT
jgi:hypothetical protein